VTTVRTTEPGATVIATWDGLTLSVAAMVFCRPVTTAAV
jgi:hypothetical protein